jgi:hypothetical protein
VAFRPRLSAGLALSAKSEHTPGVVGYQGSPTLNLRKRRMSVYGLLLFCKQAVYGRHDKLSLTVAIICGRESGRFTVLLGDDGYVLLPTIGRNNRCISY